jgi:hypothetical protein
MKNIEYRTPNVEGKGKLFIAFKVFSSILRHSIFIIQHSTFKKPNLLVSAMLVCVVCSK